MSYLQRIREIREFQFLSQEAVAKILGVDQRTYSDYERGKTRISVEKLIKLAEYYDVDMNYICGLTKERKPFPKR